MHRAYTSVVLALGLLAGACATGRPHAALGWSLGGEAHVFITDDRFAHDYHRALTGTDDLLGALEGRSVIAVSARHQRSATVLSTRGAAPAQLTLVRFHAPGSCGFSGVVTELVLAFPAGGGGGRSTPPSHVTVVALLDGAPFAAGPGSTEPALSIARAQELLRRVAMRAEVDSRGAPLGLLHGLTLDPDRANDGGEVVPLAAAYAVGIRGNYVGPGGSPDDTTLITAVAVTDTGLQHLHWVIRPRRLRLSGGMIRRTNSGMRYSLRGGVARGGGEPVLLVDEIADISPRDSRATAVDAQSRHELAAQPLALRCP